jgi:hypothetical protein
VRWLALVAVVGCSFSPGTLHERPPHDASRDSVLDTAPPPDALDLASDLVAYYPMDALPATDATGHGHDASCDGACPTVVAGERGSAYAFAKQRLDVPADAAFDTETGTIAAWLAFDAFPTPGQHACPFGAVFMAATNGNTWQLCYQDATLGLFFQDGSGGESVVGSAAAIGSGDWHHYAIEWTDASIDLYIDGGHAFGSAISPLVFDPAGILTLGADRLDNGAGGAGSGSIEVPLFGRLDDVALFDRALSPAELAAVMAGSGL